MRVSKQSTARNIVVFMTDATDHVTGLSGLTLTITASKDGGAFSGISPTVTDLGSGWYNLALTTSHTSAIGDFALHITSTGADPTDLVMQIVAYDTTDAVRLGLTALPNAAAEASGGLYTRGNGAGQITQDANGRIDTNTKAWAGTATTLTSSLPDVNTKTIASGIIAAATFAANALDAVWSTTVRTITGGTITTVSDKTGYALSTAGAQAIWDALTSASTTIGSMGKWLLDKLDVVVSTRLASGSYTAPDNATIAAINLKTVNLPPLPASTGDVTSAADTVVDTIEDPYLVPILAAVTAIQPKTDAFLDAAVSSKLSSADYSAPDNAGIQAAIDYLNGIVNTAPYAKTTELESQIDNVITAIGEPTDYASISLALDALFVQIGDLQNISIADYLISIGNENGDLQDGVDDCLAGIQQTNIKYGTEFIYQFAMYNLSGAPAAGLTVTAKFSLNGAAFVTCSNSVVEVGSGVYSITLAADETTGQRIALQFTATGAITQTSTEYLVV